MRYIGNKKAYTGLLWSGAYKIENSTGKRVMARELIADGWFGLVRAASRYNRARGEFSTYAVPRIRGAMIDGIRARVGREWSAKATAERVSVPLHRRVRVRGNEHEARCCRCRRSSAPCSRCTTSQSSGCRKSRKSSVCQSRVCHRSERRRLRDCDDGWFLCVDENAPLVRRGVCATWVRTSTSATLPGRADTP